MFKKSGILVQLDRPRHLRLDIGAVARFEFTAGKPFFSMATWEELSKRDAVILLWACLAHEDERLTPADIVKMFEREEVDETAVLGQMRTAWVSLINDFTEVRNGY